jgi:hypothetical protein
MNWKGYLGIGLGTAVVVGGGLLLFNKLKGGSGNGTTPQKKESDLEEDKTPIKVGDIVWAKNPNGINVRRGQSTDATIIFADIKGQIGKVVEIVDGVNAEGKKDGYKWCRIQLDKPINFGGKDYTIGYCRIDVLKKYKL